MLPSQDVEESSVHSRERGTFTERGLLHHRLKLGKIGADDLAELLEALERAGPFPKRFLEDVSFVFGELAIEPSGPPLAEPGIWLLMLAGAAAVRRRRR